MTYQFLIPYYMHPFKREIEAPIGELQRPVRPPGREFSESSSARGW